MRGTIDVVIPAFNAEKFILEAVRSVKFQTCSPARIIVVDDGSTDRTAEIIQKEFADDPAVVYIHKQNGGLSSARNRGILESSAEFITFLDADDVWAPTKLDDQLDIFRKSADPRLGVVYCDYDNIDAEGNPLPAYVCFKLNPEARGDIFGLLLSGNCVAGSGSAIMLRRECFCVAGTFDESLTTCEDWDMWLRLAASFNFDYVAKPLVHIRRHIQSMQADLERMFRGYVMILNKWSGAALRRRGLLPSWRAAYVHILVALIKQLPQTNLLRILAADASPQVKRLAFRQAPWITLDLVVVFSRGISRAVKSAWVK